MSTNGKHSTERTEAQKQSLRDAWMLLKAAKFDHVVIICSTSADHEALGTDMDVMWFGGWPTAAALAEFAKNRIGYSRRPKNEPK
jgi:hypothetical protein